MEAKREGDVLKMEGHKKQCVTKVMRDTFQLNWAINNFTERSWETGVLSSSIAEGERHTWNFWLFNRGDYLAVHLRLNNRGNGPARDKHVKASFKISIVDEKENILKTKVSTVHEYTTTCSSFGIDDFLLFEDILNSNYLSNRKKDLKLHFEMMMEREETVSLKLGSNENIRNPKEILARNLERLSKDLYQLVPKRSEGRLDRQHVHIISKDGAKFRAYKPFLSARSPLLKKTFEDSMSTRVVRMTSYKAEVVRGFLEFLHRAQTAEIKRNPIDLMRLGTKYKVDGLVKACLIEVMSKLTPGKAIKIYVSAHRYNLTLLKSEVFEFIKRNEEAVKKTDSLEKLMEDDNIAVADLLLRLFKA